MLYWLKPIALSLTGLSLFIGSIASLLKPVAAGEQIIDKNCHFHVRTGEIVNKIPPQNRGTVFLTSGFEVKNQKYILQVLQFPNSRGVFCLWQPNSSIPQRLGKVQLIQDKLIEKVQKDYSHPANYIVTVRGDKNEDFLRTHYRLNLINPNQPEVTPIIVVYKR
jgi:hypothetical protein